jgi:hypothetical protein
MSPAARRSPRSPPVINWRDGELNLHPGERAKKLLVQIRPRAASELWMYVCERKRMRTQLGLMPIWPWPLEKCIQIGKVDIKGMLQPRGIRVCVYGSELERALPCRSAGKPQNIAHWRNLTPRHTFFLRSTVCLHNAVSVKRVGLIDFYSEKKGNSIQAHWCFAGILINS